MKTRPANRKNLMLVYKKMFDHFGPQGWWPGDTPLEIIVGAILTQNTAWTNVEKAISNLKKAGALKSPANIIKMPMRRLARLVRPAGYYNVKSRRLKNFFSFLFSRYGGSLRKMASRKTDLLRKELLEVNGIGPETCDSILLYAFKRRLFVIDAYTRRIFSRHGFMKEDILYDDARTLFMSRLPDDKRLFNEYHALIVRLGKELCRKKPFCNECPIKNIWYVEHKLVEKRVL